MDRQQPLKLLPKRRFGINFLRGHYKGLYVSAYRDPKHCNWYALYIDGKRALIRHVSAQRIEQGGLSEYLAQAAMDWIDKRASWDPKFTPQPGTQEVIVIDDPVTWPTCVAEAQPPVDWNLPAETYHNMLGKLDKGLTEASLEALRKLEPGQADFQKVMMGDWAGATKRQVQVNENPALGLPAPQIWYGNRIVQQEGALVIQGHFRIHEDQLQKLMRFLDWLTAGSA